LAAFTLPNRFATAFSTTRARLLRLILVDPHMRQVPWVGAVVPVGRFQVVICHRQVRRALAGGVRQVAALLAPHVIDVLSREALVLGQLGDLIDNNMVCHARVLSPVFTGFSDLAGVERLYHGGGRRGQLPP
jgi:hypothetical protein